MARRQKIQFLIAAAFIFGSGYFLTANFLVASAENENEAMNTGTNSAEIAVRLKPPATIAKGIYLTAYSAANPKRLAAIEKLLDTTEMNAVVIDIKDYSGRVLYDSHVTSVQKFGARQPILKNVPDLIKELHAHNIYVIARQTVFQDPLLAEKQPAWAIHHKNGGLWRDKLGLAWVDPTNQAVWEYNLAIAREAIALGFDEINFDYVRFPSDGNLRSMVYTNGSRSRAEAMAEFYHYVNTELSDEPAWLSFDFFGLVMEIHDGLGIGQRLVDAVNEIDYISPMMYPSHYARGHLKLANPATAPGRVISYGMEKGGPLFEGKRAQVRPWLQAFHMGAHYDATKIRAQIDAVEKYPNAGWLLWNSANKYTNAGLKIVTST